MQLRLSVKKIRQALQIVAEENSSLGERVASWMAFMGISKSEKNSSLVSVDLDALDAESTQKFAIALIDSCDISAHQRLKLSKYVSNQFLSFENKYFTTARELFNHLKPLKSGRLAANVAVKLGGRAYPAHATVNFSNQEDSGFFTMRVSFNVGQYPYLDTNNIGAHFFSPPVVEISQEEKESPINLKEWLEQRKIVGLTQEILDDAAAKLEDVERLKSKTQMICTGQAIVYTNSFFGQSLEETNFGSFLYPEKVIFDTEFEQDDSFEQDDYDAHEQYPIIPLVRVFSLRLKSYLLVDVGDLTEYVYDKSAVDRIVLPGRTRHILTSVFSKKDDLLGDVVAGKHGGMVIMACGPTGVGKTLTAEVMAEYTERPLYVLELGELGTRLASMEATLELIFKRVSRWNALLLFDEADVFLHKRDDNLERSAIVGVFLRLLDYFPGVMFLTTNRSDVIDPAILSRVTMKLDYPSLDDVARSKIWGIMFGLIGQTVQVSQELASLSLNGRQIRNLMRLGVSVHGKNVTPSAIVALSEFI